MDNTVSSSAVSKPAVPLSRFRFRSRQKDKPTRRHNFAGYMFVSPWLIAFFSFTLVPC